MDKFKKFSILFIILLLLISCSKKTTETDYILSAPTDLVLSQIGFESILLNWQDNSSDEDGFRIDRKIGENNWEESYQILAENTTTFIDSNLFTIDTYYYRVYAFRDEIISGYVESEINFSYNDVSFIVPFFAGIIDLSPNESFEYRVALKDSNGNYVQRIFDVWFKFLYKPNGTNFNNIIFTTNDSISVQSENGIASVTLNAGNISGTAAIKAFTYNSENIEISTTHSDIVIHSGAPNSINVTLGGISTAEDVSMGNWRIQVAALIIDISGNPVDIGTAVYFSLPENPEWASIEAYAYVGNENANGETYPGLAFTFLEYDGCHTNDTLLIQVEAAGIFVETEEVILPIQFPFMGISITPQHDVLVWYESDPESPDSSIVTFHVSIKDGQNNPINNQQVIFVSTLGQPVDMGTDDDDNPHTEQTGIILYLHGRIDKDWIFYRDECPPPVDAELGTITGSIYIAIPGTSVVIEITITLFRYP